MADVRTRPAGLIIAFPDPAARPARVIAPEEPRGEILLFTGVRYERMEPDFDPRPALSHGQARRRRRRS